LRLLGLGFGLALSFRFRWLILAVVIFDLLLPTFLGLGGRGRWWINDFAGLKCLIDYGLMFLWQFKYATGRIFGLLKSLEVVLGDALPEALLGPVHTVM
jgi:hypothetical protein